MPDLTKMLRFIIVYACLAGLAVSASGLAAEQALPSLPPLARVSVRTEDPSTWGMQGEISGSTSVARYDFSQALMRQGWLLRCRVPVSRSGSEVLAWRKGEREILLRLMPGGPGKTNFALGKWTPPADLSAASVAQKQPPALDQNNPKERNRKQ